MQAADNWQKHGEVVSAVQLSRNTAFDNGFHHSALYVLTFRMGAYKVWDHRSIVDNGMWLRV
jgi:hypothetical protein